MIPLIIITLLVVLFIWQSILLRKNIIAIKGFELLLTTFIEINQQFYEGQKNIAKKDKEIIDALVRQSAEFSIMNKYSKQIETGLKSLNESNKNLKETNKEIKLTSDELLISKDLASSLAQVSNNIKVLDKIVIDLLKRRK